MDGSNTRSWLRCRMDGTTSPRELHGEGERRRPLGTSQSTRISRSREFRSSSTSTPRGSGFLSRKAGPYKPTRALERRRLIFSSSVRAISAFRRVSAWLRPPTPRSARRFFPYTSRARHGPGPSNSVPGRANVGCTPVPIRRRTCRGHVRRGIRDALGHPGVRGSGERSASTGLDPCLDGLYGPVPHAEHDVRPDNRRVRNHPRPANSSAASTRSAAETRRRRFGSLPTNRGGRGRYDCPPRHHLDPTKPCPWASYVGDSAFDSDSILPPMRNPGGTNWTMVSPVRRDPPRAAARHRTAVVILE